MKTWNHCIKCHGLFEGEGICNECTKVEYKTKLFLIYDGQSMGEIFEKESIEKAIERFGIDIVFDELDINKFTIGKWNDIR